MLGETERWPDRILHTLTPAAAGGDSPLDVARAEREVARGFGSTGETCTGAGMALGAPVSAP